MKQGEEKREKETKPLIWLRNVLSSWGGGGGNSQKF